MCEPQVQQARELILERAGAIVQQLTGKSPEEASKLARQYNKQVFGGNNVIISRTDYATKKAMANVNLNKTVIEKAVTDKVKADNLKQSEATEPTPLSEYEEALKKREAEVRVESESVAPDMYMVTQVDPLALSNDYDMFNYQLMIDAKLKLKEDYEKKRDLIKNKKRTKENLLQSEQMRDVIAKLSNDLTELQKPGEHLDLFLDSAMKDISNIRKLLEYPTIDNIESAKKYIQVVEMMFSNEEGKFLEENMIDIKTNAPEVWEKLAKVQGDLAILVGEKDIKVRETIFNTIKEYLKNKDEDVKWDETHLNEEVKRLYNNQMSNAREATVGESIRKNGNVDMVFSQVTMLDTDEENNILMSVLYKVYADALAMTNIQETREKLSNMRIELEKEMISSGYKTGSGLDVKADYTPFLKDDDTTHQLIGKYNKNWGVFTRSIKKEQEKVSRTLYRNDRTKDENEAIKKHFEKVVENANILDVNKIPEIIDSGEFFDEGTFSTSLQEAEDYKAEVIAQIGQREYDKLVARQIEKIHAFNIYVQSREARLRDRYKLGPNDTLLGNIPELILNAHLHYIYSKSPFQFAANYQVKGTNIISKPYFKDGTQHTVDNAPADFEYVEYFPKDTMVDTKDGGRESMYFDESFNAIENGPAIFKEAWDLMADLVEYNNNNGFNSNPDSLAEYSLASQAKRVEELPTRFLNFFTKGFLKNMLNGLHGVHEYFATSKYKDPDVDRQIAGQLVNIDQEIQSLYNRMIKGYRDPSANTQKAVRIEAKQIVMARQENDLIENLLGTTEITEKFKAKKEIESKAVFIKDTLDTVKDRQGIKSIVKYFNEKKLYQINNRANFNELKGAGKTFSFSRTQRGRFFTQYERELRAHANDTLDKIGEIEKQVHSEIKTVQSSAPDFASMSKEDADKARIKWVSDIDKKKVELIKLQKDRDDLNAYLESGGMVVTPGSIVEALFMKSARFVAFSINASAQITNMMNAKITAREVDGRKGFWDAGVYHEALSFSRKWKRAIANEQEKKEIKTGELLLQRLKLFQNSTNEIFKIEKSSARTSLEAVLENPMNFVSEVEKTIQRPQIFALFTTINVEALDPTKASVPMFDASTGTFPAFTSDSKGGLILKPEFDTPANRETFLLNNNQRYANLFGDAGKVPKALAFINGDYRDSSSYLYERTIGGALLGMFKRWTIQTLSKKYGTLNRLQKNGQMSKAGGILFLTGGAFAFATGSIAWPIGVLVSTMVLVGTSGLSPLKAQLEEDRKKLTHAIILSRLANINYKQQSKSAVNVIIASLAQTLGSIVDPFTRKAFLNSDKIKQLMKVDSRKDDGTSMTAEEQREVEEDMYFLTTSLAATLKFTVLRALVLAILAPDDDEDEEYKEMVQSGNKNFFSPKDKFFHRFVKHPSTTLYYSLENMLSGFTTDVNLMTQPEGLFRQDDLFGQAKFGRIAEAINSSFQGDTRLKSGDNEGDLRITNEIFKYYTPSMMKDGMSFGFGSKSKRDFDSQNFIDQMAVSLVDKINAKRLEVKRKEKERMVEEIMSDNPELAKEQAEKYAEKAIKGRYRVVKDADQTELYEDYY